MLLFACGELSRTPGAVDAGGPGDAGSTSPRTRCESCETYEQCDVGECAVACDPLSPLACVNGLRCALTSCVPDSIPTCDAEPCNEDQACISTYCIGVSLEACSRTDESACILDSACDFDRGRCIDLPHCDADSSCRKGDLGAVCNQTRTGTLLLAGSISPGRCLLGRCTSDAHCPEGKRCVEINERGLGSCR